jgi:hypothetical protein
MGETGFLPILEIARDEAFVEEFVWMAAGSILNAYPRERSPAGNATIRLTIEKRQMTWF